MKLEKTNHIPIFTRTIAFAIAILCFLSPIQKVVYQLVHNIEHAIEQSNSHMSHHHTKTVTTHHHDHVLPQHRHQALSLLKVIFNHDDQPETLVNKEKYNTDKQLSNQAYTAIDPVFSTELKNNWHYLESPYTSPRDLPLQPPRF